MDSAKPLTWLLLAAALIVTSALYHRGLYGPFLFDDWANLPVLGYFGPVDNWPVFWRYITAGIADPTGRPVAQLSFLVDAHDWPTDPFPFKRTNLVIHLCNGILLYFLLLRLNETLGMAKHSARHAALLAASAWMLHPLWVSTVLYVVQRQALLVATWALLTLLGYVHVRRLLPTRPVRAMAGLSLCLILGTLLATLSKANGALLPLLTGILEITILANDKTLAAPPTQTRRWKIWRWLFLWLPSILVVLFLLAKIPESAQTAAEIREFSLTQRLLTQPRVILEYLSLIFFPRPYTNGLFNDAFPFSTGWLHPWTTLPAILAVLGLLGGAVKIRKKHPALAMAVLFFFAGHLMESTVLPLELYFEHRNYLPGLFLFWPLSIAVVNTPLIRRNLKIAVSLGVLLLLALFTGMRASLWGDANQQAYLWAKLNPDSARAQTYAAQHDIHRHQYKTAVKRLQASRLTHPFSLQVNLNLISAKCALNKLAPDDVKQAAQALAVSQKGRRLLMAWTQSVLKAYTGGKTCTGLNHDSMNRLLDAASGNPVFQTPGGQQDILYLKGLVALHFGHPVQALTFFMKSMRTLPNPETVLELSAEFARRGYLEQALSLLRQGRAFWSEQEPAGWNMLRVHEWVLHKQQFWEQEFINLEQVIQNDLDKSKQKGKEHQKPAVSHQEPL